MASTCFFTAPYISIWIKADIWLTWCLKLCAWKKRLETRNWGYRSTSWIIMNTYSEVLGRAVPVWVRSNWILKRHAASWSSMVTLQWRQRQLHMSAHARKIVKNIRKLRVLLYQAAKQLSFDSVLLQKKSIFKRANSTDFPNIWSFECLADPQRQSYHPPFHSCPSASLTSELQTASSVFSCQLYLILIVQHGSSRRDMIVGSRKFWNQTSDEKIDKMERWKSWGGKSQRGEVRRSEKRKGEKKEDEGTRKGSKVATHRVFSFSNDLWLRRVEK